MANIFGIIWLSSLIPYLFLMTVNFQLLTEKKYRLLKLNLIVSCSCFLGVLLSSQDIFVELLMGGFGVLSYWKIYKGCLFCPNCTKPIIQSGLWKIKHCPKCGIELKKGGKDA